MAFHLCEDEEEDWGKIIVWIEMYKNQLSSFDKIKALRV
jgi:hypothetical protein